MINVKCAGCGKAHQFSSASSLYMSECECGKAAGWNAFESDIYDHDKATAFKAKDAELLERLFKAADNSCRLFNMGKDDIGAIWEAVIKIHKHRAQGE